MIFNSMIFIWVALPILLIVYYFLNNTLKNLFLVLASLFFYAWGSIETISILLISILANYILGALIDKSKKMKLRKVFLTLGIIVNIGILGYFKYYNFFVENINIVVFRNESPTASLFEEYFCIRRMLIFLHFTFYTINKI